MDLGQMERSALGRGVPWQELGKQERKGIPATDGCVLPSPGHYECGGCRVCPP